jgi:hypothetical protein
MFRWLWFRAPQPHFPLRGGVAQRIGAAFARVAERLPPAPAAGCGPLR